MIIVFDIGGTTSRIAGSKDGNTLSEPVMYPTPQLFEDGLRQLIETANHISAGETITAIAGGIAGPMDAEKTMLVQAPHLTGWNNKPFKKMLEQELHVPVFLEKDTGMWGVGESLYGSGKGYDIMAYITVSTGVGGARIVHGKIDRGVQGFEPGHQIINPNGPTCSCGGSGHLEAYISGTALEERTGIAPKEITDPAVWDEEARYVAIGLLNTAVFWSPYCIVLGGSMMNSISVERVQFYMDSMNHILPSLPTIKKSVLENTGGLLGALSVATASGA